MIKPEVSRYRRNAARCAEAANTESSLEQRIMLLNLARSWLALADNHDWLNGDLNAAGRGTEPRSAAR
ncbi:MAG: hypothetical protein HXY30_01975 [Pseudorhodoplanes sp.]|nr:hypothetical protein [Pseudorhodoplanes sp.]